MINDCIILHWQSKIERHEKGKHGLMVNSESGQCTKMRFTAPNLGIATTNITDSSYRLTPNATNGNPSDWAAGNKNPRWLAG